MAVEGPWNSPDKRKPEGTTCKHLLNGAPDCVFCHRDQLKQEVERLKTACRILWHFGQPEADELRAEIIALADIGSATPQPGEQK